MGPLVAQSKIDPLAQQQPQQGALAPTPQPGGQAPGLGQQVGGAAKGFASDALGTAAGAALTPALGPLGPIAGQALAGVGTDLVGGLFGLNSGGQVPGYNDGGGPLANPNGYKEGGAVTATPIKKMMDMDKMAMAREAFEKGEARKDMLMDQQMMQKDETHNQAMTMKTEAATVKTKGPLGG